MQTNGSSDDVGLSAKIGAWLFAIWGVLHVWVGAEGVHQYLTGGTSGLWNMLIGGGAVSRAAFVHATDSLAVYACSGSTMRAVRTASSPSVPVS